MSAADRNILDVDGHGTPPADFHDNVHKLFNYWNQRHGEGRLPDRKDIDPPLDFPRMISGIWLLDVIDGGRRFRYRLIGEALHAAGGTPRVGEFLDEQPDVGGLQRALKGLRGAVSDGVPYWRRGIPHLRHDKLVSGLEFIGLPLTHGGSDVAMLLNYTLYTRVS